VNTRTYRQTTRASAAAEKTERILDAGLALFMERPFDQVTLPAVAERAGVGLQTLIRRVGTKDGLVAAVNEWIVPQVEADRGEPTADPAAVTAAMARHNERWGAVILRTLQQEDAAPTLAATAAAGRAAHREWIAACFAVELADLPAARRRQLTAQLVAVCGTELWMVLTRGEGLSTDEARTTVHDLITATLDVARTTGARS
jgi:AcrR family transcriptional regulator